MARRNGTRSVGTRALCIVLCVACALGLVAWLVPPSLGMNSVGGANGNAAAPDAALSAGSVRLPRGAWNPVVVILGHDRFDHVVRLMRELDGQPDFFLRHFHIVVSLDDPRPVSPKVMARIDGALADLRRAGCKGTEVWRPRSQPTREEKAWRIEMREMSDDTARATLAIARHYKTALDRAFTCDAHGAPTAATTPPRFSHAIMVEDDLSIAPDFLELFASTAWRLDAEPTKLWCVSAWNDLGLRHVLGSKAATRQHAIGTLQRTTFFPGLGWMLRASLWREQLSATWPPRPSTGWDHWMRLDLQVRVYLFLFLFDLHRYLATVGTL